MLKKQQRAQAKSKTRDESEPNSLETSETREEQFKKKPREEQLKKKPQENSSRKLEKIA
jgi:hypothetical protein